MHAVTNGVSTGSSLALAYKLLSWVDHPLPLPELSHRWQLEPYSFILGLFVGLTIYTLLEAWWITEATATEYDRSAEGSDSRADSRDFQFVDRDRAPAAAPEATSRASPSPSPSVGTSSQRCSLFWEERENIADQIGLWVARAIAGENRGESGRARNPLASKLWIVARDLAGQIYTPVKVFRTWGSAKALVKSGSIVGDSVFVGMNILENPPLSADDSAFVFDEGSARNSYSVSLLELNPERGPQTTQIILITEFEGKSLVAVPVSVWNRSVSKRELQPQALTKATLVQVQAVAASNLAAPLPDVFIQLWIGYLKPSVMENVQTHLEEFDADFVFGYGDSEQLLPLADALVAVAQEHFAFFSATEQEPQDVDAAEAEEELERAMDGLAELGSDDVRGRLSGLESSVMEMKALLQTLAAAKTSAAKKKVHIDPTPRTSPPASSTSPRRKSALKKPGTRTPSTVLDYPDLDPSVVQAALQAGVPSSSLVEMQRLIGGGVKAKKLSDLTSGLAQVDPLSEDETEGNQMFGDEMETVEVGDEAGSPGTLSPVEATLDRLTSLMEILAEDRKKNAKKSLLESALDHAGTSSADSSGSLGSKKSAIARRALRSTFVQNPAEIYQLIEKLLYEDINSQALPPGMVAPPSSARSWVEYRSRIGNYRATAHCAWQAAGIWDSLMKGHVAKARAQAALMCLMIDQASIDRGSWVLAAELSLDQGPPMAMLATHQMPAIQDGEAPYSKLLDPRWAEISLGHLRDQDEYLTRRKNLGKNWGDQSRPGGGDHTAPEPDSKRKPKPKAKPKPGAKEKDGAGTAEA
eukprot:Skav218190  [mRNA]  locus=scaffold5213:278481:281188:- [translate_table: standard]